MKNLKGGDLLGGLMAAIVALPLALAFGEASGLGAQAGLYGAIACGILATAFGGTPSQVSGPTGPMTVVTAGLVATHPGHPEIIFAAIILAGLLQMVLGKIRAGQYIEHIPGSVVSGFMSGIGLIIILIQLRPLAGEKVDGDVMASLMSLPELAGNIHPKALWVGLITLGIIYLLPLLTKKIPAMLLALLVATGLSIYLGWDVPHIGEIPSGLPVPNWPYFESGTFKAILTGGITLALLGSLDSLLTSLVVDKMSNTRHDSNRELIGQGIGNIAAGLLGGLPGAGATMRSVVNYQAGGRTRISGIIHGILLLLVLCGLGSLAANIPMACLAGILISVGISIIDYKGLSDIGRTSWQESAVMLLVLTLTVFGDLIMAVAVGMAAATILGVRKTDS